ncbi:undecaprenyldiphospho-muramoylpentapeptide beta-N-acetylglucosaminyltransferase [Lujinxingia vulgaris]|uniref:UDP-N-acetylglucosamine--N-acetylmuramyl-(pentapeptide) pyrophosphoryl-undecaprenol N-acetylglucosamine transferase n=1 Tax=Lujinxingia vulgaris TaxID=2600176 RepID=A0A5C6X6M8_9DELT|nr:undecaprenyldiphospho-muramoylpentapeptide beta-N-acetylglucosaminyltransferase [Lujinxingia vulgaris]TXD37534.1 undecaprenyldiphospho-muramoylpentapeptide beta-N-acetylglucosaminyltransferase [Lujinxingia vulgaris]
MTSHSQTPPHLVIAGGGTGGHLFPGVAVAQAFERLAPGARVTFVGTERGIEARVIPKLGYDLELVDVVGLKGSGALGLARGLARLPRSGLQARGIVKRLAPTAVVSVGGYAAGPITLAAALSGVPAALMEQNAIPGLTNKLLSRVVDHAFLTFEESAEHLGGVSHSVPGNPVREELLTLARTFTYEPPAAAGPFRVLIIGGSGGAGSFNEHLPGWFKAMGALQSRLEVRHQAGRNRADAVRPRYEGFEGKVVVEEFIDDMAEAYRWCDLLICRAGATTIAEVLNLGLPAIYVPFPQAADDHQRFNARSVVEAGAGVMLDDSELGSERSVNLLAGLMRNPESLGRVAAAARRRGRPDAAETIASALLAMGRGELP